MPQIAMISQTKSPILVFLLIIAMEEKGISQNHLNNLVSEGVSPVYSTKVIENSIFVSNKINSLPKQKFTHNHEQIGIGGFNVKQAKINLLSAIDKILNMNQKNEFNGINIGVTLLLRKNGKIDEVSFQLPKNSQITFGTLKVIEDTLLKVRYPVKDELRNDPINYFPMIFILRSSDFTK